ncbi:hypothetical protein J2Z47_004830 [Cohnella thailandensis]|nr:hypothetical protein [Cohnella thailandensis]
MIEESENDLKLGRVYTTEEMIEEIKRGGL